MCIYIHNNAICAYDECLLRLTYTFDVMFTYNDTIKSVCRHKCPSYNVALCKIQNK